MAAIHQLIDQIEDERLRARLREEANALTQGRSFGLVFERHLPEVTPIYRARPRRGDAVAVRGEPLEDLWRVQRIQQGQALCQHLTRGQVHAWPLDQLLVVRRFGEPIFPALKPMDRVANGPADAPWHTLIEADNFHALQLLEYLYAGQVDCIYIDPPYNSGARDWKYNNDYVDKNDSWRHSKWLAFMERRLKLAKRLLKKSEGVLIVTIDENEIHHLGMLLEAAFPEYVRQMVTIIINPKGTGKLNFARVEEQALYCIPNVEGGVIKGLNISTDDGDGENNDCDTDSSHLDPEKVHLWELRHARRRGSESSYRHQRWNQFYPLYVDEQAKVVIRTGQSIPLDAEPDFSRTNDGLTPIWPIDHDGNHRCWRFISTKMQSLINQQRVVLGKYNRNKGTWTVNIWEKKPSSIKLKTVWWETLHDAGTHGTTLLADILGRRGAFAFPKSVYATRDAIAAVVSERPDALIVDFFAGSGSTLNAVQLLNVADSGKRRCIMVTNNEVSSSEADNLSSQGLKPGDADWESHGICQSVTWPRTKYTILGRRDDGTQLEGEYSTGQTREVERPRRFRHINFVTGAHLDTLAKRRQFLSLVEGLPQTLASSDLAHVVSEEHTISVLFDEAQAETWLEALDGQDHITEFIIVAPTRPRFNEIKAQVEALLGPAVVSEELKRPMREGFPANVEYFRLDFLDPEQVALKRQFREVLPLLWMRAGCYGPRPVLAAQAPLPAWLLPEANRFAVLLEEERFRDFLPLAHERADLTHVFLVTDAEEAFQEMAAELPPGVLAVQLYRDYLENFLINRGERA